jgi:hypothetical protein
MRDQLHSWKNNVAELLAAVRARKSALQK